MAEREAIERIAEPVLNEFRLAFQGLRDSIRAIPREEWTRGDRKGKVPVRQACHLLWACMAYTTGWKVKAADRFGVPAGSFHRAINPADYPNQAAVLEYVDEVEARIEEWVPELVEQTLSGKRKKHPPLGRAIYLLRHTVVHLAYLRREMYERDIPRPTY